MRRISHYALACLLALAGATLTLGATISPAVAANATVTACDEAGFDAALQTVQASGGGTLSFTCSGTLTFTAEKTITSHVIIEGAGQVTIDGNGTTRLFYVNSGATLDLRELSLQNGSADEGGAILNANGTLRVTGSVLDNNSASVGGAIGSVGKATIVGSTLRGNQANIGGAVIAIGTPTFIGSTFQGNHASERGGALTLAGIVTIATSTFIDNSADTFGGALELNGAGVENVATIAASTFAGNRANTAGGAISNAAYTSINASTFSGNNAEHGGAIENRAGLNIANSTLSANNGTTGGGILTSSDLAITRSTLSGNSAQFGAAVMQVSGSIAFNRTIIANSAMSASCFSVDGSILGTDVNLSDDASCPFSLVGSTSVNLGPLQDNGGPTQTMLPLAGSDAIDSASCTTSYPLDQRGAPRPLPPASTCDIGAVEVGAVVPGIQILLTEHDGPVSEGSSPAITVYTYSATGGNLSYRFDCDNDGSYETPGSGVGNTGIGHCTLLDDARYPLGIQVCDANNGNDCVTALHTIVTHNVRPTVDSPIISPETSNEGQSVAVSATFTDPGTDDTHTCTIDYGDGTGAQAGTVEANTCIGPSFTYVDDNPSGTPADSYVVTVTVIDDDGGIGRATADHTVNNLAPSISGVSNDGPANEGFPVTITVAATDPGNADTLSYTFDCDNDGSYETQGAGHQRQCVFGNDGSYLVPFQVTDDDTGSVGGNTTVQVLNAPPAVDPALVAPEESNEGDSVTATASFTDPGTDDTHTCTIDYGDGSGAQPGTVDGYTCTGPAHTYLDDDPTGTPSDEYTVTVMVTDSDGASGESNLQHTVNNVAPEIEGVSSAGPVSQGQPATVSVEASDVGINDQLSYSFDCDGDSSYETGPQAAPVADCPLDPATATTTIGVMVVDDDGGTATSAIDVHQTLTLCGSYYTGGLTGPTAGGCANGAVALTLPAATATTVCVNTYTGALTWSSQPTCPGGRPHVVPDNGPLRYCESLWTGALRYSHNGQCAAHEFAGVIPG